MLYITTPSQQSLLMVQFSNSNVSYVLCILGISVYFRISYLGENYKFLGGDYWWLTKHNQQVIITFRGEFGGEYSPPNSSEIITAWHY